jgi:hypothetical protein
VLRFVSEQWRFLSASTPLQPRYAKQAADEDGLMAAIVAQDCSAAWSGHKATVDQAPQTGPSMRAIDPNATPCVTSG